MRPTGSAPVVWAADHGIGRITLNRPERMNAITVELAGALTAAVTELGADCDINVVVIRGSGGNFCAGGDFAEVERLGGVGEAALRTLFDTFREACEAIARVAAPVVAAVEGVAMAGGFELMQAADIVLVSDTARIADNHVNFGMIPGGGSTQRLARLVGRQQAMGMLLSGDHITGADAARCGLAYQCFPDNEFDDCVQRFAAALAARNRSSVVAIKRLVTTGLDLPLAAGLDDEISAVVEHISGGGGAAAFTQRGTHR